MRPPLAEIEKLGALESNCFRAEVCAVILDYSVEQQF
jgi:hypothetical protein